MKGLKIGKEIMKGSGNRIAKIALVSVLAATIGSNAWAAISLGAASPYAVFQLGGTGAGNFNISDAYINGNVALGPGTYNTSIGGNFGVNGNVYDSGNRSGLTSAEGWDTTTPLGQNPTSLPFTGTINHNVDLSQAVSDALAASAAAAALPADFNLGSVSGSQTILLNSVTQMTPGVYVINTTQFTLNNGQVLTLNGTGIPPGSQVIINVSGQFTLNGGTIALAGGLTADHVLVNNINTTQAASITGGGQLFGSFLGPTVNAQFNNNSAAVYGQVIVQSVQFSSHFRVFGELFVPEPSTIMAGILLLLPFGASTLRILRKSC